MHSLYLHHKTYVSLFTKDGTGTDKICRNWSGQLVTFGIIGVEPQIS
jgi:hypothetical protein